MLASPTSKCVAAAVSGALLVLALPKPDLYFLSWIALVPLLLSLSSVGSRTGAFGLGYTAGVAFFAGSCYWIVSTMATYGGLSVPASVGVFAIFVAVFALHTGLFALLLHIQMTRFPTWGLLGAAPTWVAIEFLQAHLVFGGFPWMLAGYGLAPYGRLLQIATVTGVYGLSFVLVGVSALLTLSLGKRSTAMAALASGMMVISAFVGPPAEEAPEDPLSVRLVQTNIDIEQSWESRDRQELLDTLQQLSLGRAEDLDLLIWPETPAPFLLEDDSDFRYRMEAIARSMNAHFLIGYIGFSNRMPTNSAGVLSPSGQLLTRYDKIHLVPFGEYVPLRNILFFAESLVRNVGDFVAGSDFTLTPLDGHELASTICYEDVFPNLIREFTKRGAEVIVNITNDGWFGSTSAPYQHLRMSSVRAVENRRYMLRGANTGITAIIDPYGRVISSTELGRRTILDGTAGYRSDVTFYVRFGDVFAWAATSVTIVMVGLSWAGRRSRSAKKKHE